MTKKVNLKYIILLLLCFSFISKSTYAGNLSGKRISSIGISGNYPYIESKIRRYIALRPGDIYRANEMDEQIKRIKRFYDREGWQETQINVDAEYNHFYKSVELHFKIDRGYLLRYDAINVVGDYSLPKSLVATKINQWKPYKPRELRKAIHEITNKYRENGYPLARVKLADKSTDRARHRISVTIEINQGPYVEIQFRGNDHISSGKLGDVITIIEEGAIDTYELEESAKAIEKLYKNNGFPNTTVDFDRTHISEKEILIIFKIDEGLRQWVRSIQFKGNNKISTPELESVMHIKTLSLTERGVFTRRILKNDIKRIEEHYHKKGFISVEVGSPDIERRYNDKQLIITIPIEEGKQAVIKKVFFSGDTIFPKERHLKVVESKRDKPLNPKKVTSDVNNLISFYGNNGYPYAKVEAESDVDKDNYSSVIHFNISPGPKVHFGNISIVGDFLTSQKAIMKAIDIKEGDPFSYKKLALGEISLRRLGAFGSADIDLQGLEEKQTTIPLEIQVEEIRPFRLDFDIGYSTDENLVAGIDFTNINSFGWAKISRLRLIGGRKFSKAEIGWIDPKFLGHDLELTLGGWLQFEDKNVFKYIEVGSGVGLFRRYHRTSFLARMELNRNYFLSGSSTAADAESLRNNTILQTSLSMSFDTRNSFADPTKGIYTRGYSNFFNEIRGNNANFVKLGFYGGAYYTIWDRITLANDARFENIQTFGNNVSVPSNRLLLLGGDNTIRGFGENTLGPTDGSGNATGGRLRFIMNNELRILLFGNIKGVIFHDMGFLTNSFSEIDLNSLRHSVGVGMDYVTPVGPIKIGYGFIADPKPGEGTGRFHLTFGSSF